ncbi:sensor histidine kinase [Ectopseudomonas alcaliphila]|uniref:sensor histidine kinase n=1 Tax=Ectopseudomonas alcaliphila TaxID=101564 RepID=UPI00278A2D1D|nr:MULTISPECIES: ATP-binding protein [Pseudomonas]MDP9940911.1 signal transduction histidine kinase [Pseudomonas sp. 3400]MDR7013130.1 signal transduction histidine kinase [Pseudomonas alcaliphila]
MMRLVLLCVLLLASELAVARGCADDWPARVDTLSVFEDPGAGMSLEQVLALPDSAFDRLDQGHLFASYSHSAFWLRLSLAEVTTPGCARWLTVGEPRLTDIQVFVEEGEHWRRMQAGSAYPAVEWPVLARQPIFPLLADNSGNVLIRVMSRSLVIVEPLLWSEQALLAQRQRSALVDGLSLGIVLLVVPFSLIIGGIMRSPLLLTHAATVFGYIIGTCVLSGYLVHWPALLPWSDPIRSLVSVVSFTCFLGYARVLLRVRYLPRAWAHIYSGLLLLFIASHLWTLLLDHTQGNELTDLLRRISVYLVIPLTLLAAWYRGLSLIWMAWAVPLLYLTQFMVRYVLQMDQVIWQSRQDAFSLSSVVPGVVMLTCTLITELYRSRRRAQRARVELDDLREAEQESLESMVARRTAQLRESLQARGAMLARITHDLRTPLLDIVEYARRLAGVGSQDYPGRIERSAKRQLALIDELLEFSRSELPHNEMPGDLHLFLREIGEEVEPLAQRQRNHLEMHLAEDVPQQVSADFRRLRTVLVNLLSNAAKFTHEGRIDLRVTCQQQAANSVCLRFSVEDTGMGIHPDDQQRLLQPFERGRDVAAVDGCGLGLAIVSQALQAMGSELHLRSDGVQGSRFSFELNLALADEQSLAVLA